MDFENFTIRPIKEEDAENYFKLIENNRENIAEFFPDTVTDTKDINSTISLINKKVSLWEKREGQYFTVYDILTKKIIGVVSIKNIDWKTEKCELSFFIDNNYRSRGVTTKAVKLIIEYCFRDLQLNKVFLRIAEKNIASRHVAEKNGFIKEGILRKDFKTSDGRWLDLIYYGLLNDTKSLI